MGAGLLSLGICVGLVSSFIQSLGLTLQRKSYVSYPSIKPWRRPMWRAGFATFICSNLAGSSVQITTLPLTVLAPLHASGLVYNAILATLLLGEPFTYLCMFGTILVAIGATLIAVFGAINEPSHTLVQLLSLFARPAFATWMSTQVVLVIGLVIGIVVMSKSKKGKTESNRTLQGAILGSLAGLLAAHGLLLAKTTVELLVRTIGDHENQFNRWQAWVIPSCLGVSALAQLFILNRGLKLCTTSILYPLNFSVYNIITIIDGLIYYRQVSRLSVLQICMVVLGLVILLFGVVCLSWRMAVKNDAQVALSVTCSNAAPGAQDIWLPPNSGCGVSEREEAEIWNVLDDEAVDEHSPLLLKTRDRKNWRSPNIRLPRLFSKKK